VSPHELLARPDRGRGRRRGRRRHLARRPPSQALSLARSVHTMCTGGDAMSDDMIVCLCERIDDLVREIEQVRLELAALERENVELNERLEWYRRHVAA